MSLAASHAHQVRPDAPLRLRAFSDDAAPPTTLHERINAVVEGFSIREIAECVGLNAETVRRYVRGAEPSVEFVARLCEAFEIASEWLLFGAGPMRKDECLDAALQKAGYARLLGALARRLEHAER